MGYLFLLLNILDGLDASSNSILIDLMSSHVEMNEKNNNQKVRAARVIGNETKIRGHSGGLAREKITFTEQNEAMYTTILLKSKRFSFHNYLY